MRWIPFFLTLTWANYSVSQINSGTWTAYIDYGKYNVPFNFDIRYDGEQPVIKFTNGEEEIVVDRSEVKGDSIIIPLDPFDAEIKARISDGKMSGTWFKYYWSANFPFSARLGGVRFNNSQKVYAQIPDRLPMIIEPDGDKDPALGLFKQVDNQVTGTIITETGDYRYFEGIMDGDSLKMSSFDGAHGFMILAKKSADQWKGKLVLSGGYTEDWISTSIQTATLPQDPFKMVELDNSTKPPFYDLIGAGSGKDAINPRDYEGKVLIVQVFGTWCPNSMDLTNYLVNWYAEKHPEVEVIASTYEPKYSKEYGNRRIKEYQEAMKVPYNIFLGGKLSKAGAAMPYPFIKKLAAFPTLVFIDKKGQPRYVHSYFTGPATGEYYSAFDVRFREIIDELVTE